MDRIHWNPESLKPPLRMLGLAAKQLFQISVYVVLATAIVSIALNHRAAHGANEFMYGALAVASLAGEWMASLPVPWNAITLVYVLSIPAYLLVRSIRRG